MPNALKYVLRVCIEPQLNLHFGVFAMATIVEDTVSRLILARGLLV